jgi:hypothetical protein
MVTSSTNPATSTGAKSEHPSSDHPAYWPLLAHYQRGGQSATRALALLAQNWDEDVQGPLPSVRSARHWAQVDAWDARIDEGIAALVIPYHAYVETLLVMNAADVVRTLVQVMNGEYPEPRLAHAATRAAVAVLEHAGFGPPSRRKAIKPA